MVEYKMILIVAHESRRAPGRASSRNRQKKIFVGLNKIAKDNLAHPRWRILQPPRQEVLRLLLDEQVQHPRHPGEGMMRK